MSLLRRVHLQTDGAEAVGAALQRTLEFAAAQEEAVRLIVDDVRRRGDAAVLEYTARFDRFSASPADLLVPEAEMEAAEARVSEAFRRAMGIARERITTYHRAQLRTSWMEEGPCGERVGQRITPLGRVGVYVPGGTAPYPSSVLMNVVPAKVAGVESVIVVTPPGPSGEVDPHVLVAARLAGADAVYRIGGAQAIAALAFGTATVPRVDKITGPGNLYVTLAKKAVYGRVGIDMLAGPSEVFVIADTTADPAYVAADLLSQAEHDVLAASVLVTTSSALADAVEVQLATQLDALPRREIAAKALSANGCCVVVPSLEDGIEIANAFAPEHLELLVREPEEWLAKVRNAGTVFLGSMSPEPVGDYLAGTNHILPTHGTARFASGLSVDDFVKKTSVVAFSDAALAALGPEILTLAGVEGFGAHANAVRLRLERLQGSGTGERIKT